MKDDFNLIICGIGGQGIITLTRVIAEAFLIEKKEVKSSQVHGLSQRGGSVLTHLRAGKNIYSPLIKEKGADLILALELQELIRNLKWVNKKTFILADKKIIKISPQTKQEKIINFLTSNFKKLKLIEAEKIARENFQNPVLAGTILLSFAVKRKILPLKENSIILAFKKIFPKKISELNKKAFYFKLK